MLGQGLGTNNRHVEWSYKTEYSISFTFAFCQKYWKPNKKYCFQAI